MQELKLITQLEIAKACGVTQPTVRQWLLGNTTPKIKHYDTLKNIGFDNHIWGDKERVGVFLCEHGLMSHFFGHGRRKGSKNVKRNAKTMDKRAVRTKRRNITQ